MFGLSWGQIAIILLVGVFVLGPERIPTAVSWVLKSLRKVRTMAAGAQAELRREIGPEIEELRRQVADLQSLKEIHELRDLRDLHPKRLIGKNILGDEFSGGITGFLGLNEQNRAAPATTNGAAAESAPSAPTVGNNGSPPHLPPSMTKQSASASAPGSPATAEQTARQRTAAAASSAGASSTGVPPTGTPSTTAPSMTKLAAPKVVGAPAPRQVPAVLASGERPPFDPDGT